MVETLILPIDDPQAILAAENIIKQGGLIAFPTDTIYGVAADPFNPEALEKVYMVKERPDEKALPVLIGDLSQLNDLVSTIREDVFKIAASFWPGALTLVLPKAPSIPAELSAYPTIGVRMPDLAFALSLLKQTGPLATTSANISNGPNPISAQDVIDQLGGRIDLILDGGQTPGHIASTVVDATTMDYKILREGPIRMTDLQSLINKD
jgi:L-threonylcarbamoyladenylate synthase